MSRSATVRFVTVLGVGLVVATIIVLTVVIANQHIVYGKVTKTSPNTWHIEDGDNNPEKYIGRTCASQGGRVVQISQPSQAYDELNVVCS